MSYAEFLDTKERRVPEMGRRFEDSDVNKKLYDWQRRIVVWAAGRGRAAIFADCGLGKTFMQLEWARLLGGPALIIAPLSVARQTVREAARLGTSIEYVRHQDEVTGDGIWITNYEMAGRFTPDAFDSVVLDESSILKNVDGKTRRALTHDWAAVPFRLACTATPAPNDVAELTNHAEYLGVMSRAEMLSAYFVHDEKLWRLKGHASEAMFRWMASWAVALRRPSDLGYADEGFALPPLRIHSEVVRVEMVPEGQLFATDLGGIGGRAQARRTTLPARVARTVELVGKRNQWLVWCGLNDEADQLGAAIPGAVNVPGSWQPEAKAAALEAFQDGDIRVLVTKPSIAGFGMNFQNASRMVFCGIGDSYESYYQAIRRCWRFGQSRPVDVHIVASELEQQIVANVRRKEAEASTTTSALVRYVAAELADEVAA